MEHPWFNNAFIRDNTQVKWLVIQAQEIGLKLKNGRKDVFETIAKNRISLNMFHFAFLLLLERKIIQPIEYDIYQELETYANEYAKDLQGLERQSFIEGLYCINCYLDAQ